MLVMMERGSGNLLDVQVDALVNTVNCVGVMGKGLALQFKLKYPAMYQSYRKACNQGQVRPGRMHVWEQFGPPRYIVNFPTKRHWRDASRLEDIQSGLDDLVHLVNERSIRSIAIPPLGCGLGGLTWNQVKPLILAACELMPEVTVHLFEPKG